MRQQQALVVVEGIAVLMQLGIQNGEFQSDLDPLDVAQAFITWVNPSVPKR